MTRPTTRFAAAASLLLVSAVAGVLRWTRSDLSAAELLREARVVEASAPAMPVGNHRQPSSE